MKIRNGFVGNSSSSSFIIVGGCLNYEGDSLSYEEFERDYLEDCIFGNWFEYDLKEYEHSSRNQLNVNFVDDEQFVKEFCDENNYGIILPQSCEDKYKQLKNKILSIKYTNEKEYREQLKEKDILKNEIVKYCSSLLKPDFESYDIHSYSASDHDYTSDGLWNMEEYVSRLFDIATCRYKKYFNRH